MNNSRMQKQSDKMNGWNESYDESNGVACCLRFLVTWTLNDFLKLDAASQRPIIFADVKWKFEMWRETLSIM